MSLKMSLVEQILDDIDAERLEKEEKRNLIIRRSNEKLYKEQNFYYKIW